MAQKRKGNIFQTGEFSLHSGGVSNFKIECDELSDADLETIAMLISEKFDFNFVIGIPTGGEALAEKLEKYVNEYASKTLIVDDVLSTGSSMEDYHYLAGQENIGVVIFARGSCSDWITPIFQMWEN